ncbi:MAG: hypothetical protein CO094_03805 [Anaerolineae bacterium CG_4_9_14_3_um_filter_57_17]|nr:helix-turn-helix domain-containing protein [bacterium]NCT20160.1 helix-turn-helix domain-containing protein [bacterium]OIO86881.1 MAG: hypothetical protein AUK01_01575 [Anaerolineae bacterium CG2_30_57_67]PJB67479.1 MAG: hypothetical protein CO094_03805 [Anaerolineae bacterium CG_4_9_14_3_um_filter_57_17]
MLTTFPPLLPIPEAARRYGLAIERIQSLIENGKISAAMINNNVVVSEDDVRHESAPLHKEDLPEYKMHAHLQGVEIGLAEAAEKYKMNTSTIFGWFQKGIISKIRRITALGGEKILLDETDVAYCVEIYRKIGGQGRRIFDKRGMPYKPSMGSLVR